MNAAALALCFLLFAWPPAAGADEAAGNARAQVQALMRGAEADLAVGRNPGAL
jgi:hypothetical protein